LADKDLFPKELWSTLEGEEGEDVRKSINRAIQKKSLTLGSMNDPKEKSKAALDKIFAAAGDGDDIEDAEEEVEDDGGEKLLWCRCVHLLILE
jgi:DNA-directed RNA polymerase III subunit RPC7